MDENDIMITRFHPASPSVLYLFLKSRSSEYKKWPIFVYYLKCGRLNRCYISSFIRCRSCWSSQRREKSDSEPAASIC